jgi:hypothetical protein
MSPIYIPDRWEIVFDFREHLVYWVNRTTGEWVLA